MDYQLIVRKEAEADIYDAYIYYESCREGLGREFLLSVEAGIESIKRNPLQFRELYRNISRCIVQRFPYGIFFVVQNNQIIVLAVIHARRNPTAWP